MSLTPGSIGYEPDDEELSFDTIVANMLADIEQQASAPPPAPVPADVGLTHQETGQAYAPAPEPVWTPPAPSNEDYFFLEQNTQEPMWAPQITFTPDPEVDPLEQSIRDLQAQITGITSQLEEAPEEIYRDYEPHRRWVDLLHDYESTTGELDELIGQYLSREENRASMAGEGAGGPGGTLYADGFSFSAADIATPRIRETVEMPDGTSREYQGYLTDVVRQAEADYEDVYQRQLAIEEQFAQERAKRAFNREQGLLVDQLHTLGDTDQMYLRQRMMAEYGIYDPAVDPYSDAGLGQGPSMSAPFSAAFDLLPGGVQDILRAGGGALLRSFDIPADIGRTAGGALSVAGDVTDQILRGTGLAMNPSVRGPVTGDTTPIARTIETARSLERGDYGQSFREGQDAYDQLPALARLPAEMVYDPWNLVAPVVWGNRARRAIGLRALKWESAAYLDNALKSGSAVDLQYADAVATLARENLSVLDAVKIHQTGNKLAIELGASHSKAAPVLTEFSHRLTTRMYATSPTEWGRVRNEELAWLAEQGVTVNSKIENTVTAIMRETRASLDQGGKAFWTDLHTTAPDIAKDSPAWRAARNRELTPVEQIVSGAALREVSLASLVAAGFDSSDFYNGRWRAIVDANAANRTATPTGLLIRDEQPLALGPGDQESARAAFASEPPSKEEVASLKQEYRKQNKPFTEPKTIQEAQEMWRDLGGSSARPFPDGPTVDNVLNHPAYREFETRAAAGAPQQPGSQALTPGNRATLRQLYMLDAASRRTGQNYIAALMVSSADAPAMSKKRASQLISAEPASFEQKTLLRTLRDDPYKGAAKNTVKHRTRARIPLTDADIDKLTREQAHRIISQFQGEAKSVKTLRQVVADDPRQVLLAAREEQFQLEYQQIVADLLPAAGKEGEFNQHGYVRMSVEYLVTALRRSGDGVIADKYTNLPYYGPILREIARADMSSAHGRQLAQRLIDALAETVESAPDYVTARFAQYLDQLYTDSKILQINQSKARARRPLPAGKISEARQLWSEFRGLVTARNRLTLARERLDRYEAIAEATSYVDSKGVVHRLNFNDITTDALRAHMQAAGIRARDWPVILREFLLEARVNPKGWGQEYRELRGEVKRLTDEIREREAVIREVQPNFDPKDRFAFEDYQVHSRVKEYADQLGLAFSEVNTKYHGELGIRAALHDSTADVAFAVANLTNPRPAHFAYSPVVEALAGPARPGIGAHVAGRNLWGGIDPAPFRPAVAQMTDEFTTQARTVYRGEGKTAELTRLNVRFETDVASDDPVSEALFYLGSASPKELKTKPFKEMQAAFFDSGFDPKEAIAEGRKLAEAVRLAGRELDVDDLVIRNGRLDLTGERHGQWKAWLLETVTGRRPLAIVDPTSKKVYDTLSDFLDQFHFTLASGSEELARWAQVEGIDIGRHVTTTRPRQSVPVLSPLAAALPRIEWASAGGTMERVMRMHYAPDPNLAVQTTRKLAQLTKSSQVTRTGDQTELMAVLLHSVALANGTRFDDPYIALRDLMDDLMARKGQGWNLGGAAIENTPLLGEWHQWMSTPGADGVTPWQALRDRWHEFTPHKSIGRLPEPLLRQITQIGDGTEYSGKLLVKKLDRLDKVLTDPGYYPQWMRDMSDAQRNELRLFRDAYGPTWAEQVRPQLYDAEAQTWKTVSGDDLDNLLFREVEPYDPELFAQRLAGAASELHAKQIGYVPGEVDLLLKVQQAIKRNLGMFWLRATPRYLTYNVAGNTAGALLAAVRPGSHILGSSAVAKETLGRASAGVHRHRMLKEAFVATETGTQGARRVDGAEAGSIFGRPFRWVENTRYMQAMTKVNDAAELAYRELIYGRELAGEYAQLWTAAVDDLSYLDAGLRTSLRQAQGMDQVARVLAEHDAPQWARNAVIRRQTETLARSQFHAYDTTRKAMRDYAMRTNFDGILDRVYPYHFWMTKNIGFVTGTVLDRPAVALHAARIYDEWQTQWEHAPPSFKEKLRLFPELPGRLPLIGGRGDVWMRPNNLTNPWFFAFPAVLEEMGQAWDRYEDMSWPERFANAGIDGLATFMDEAGYAPGPQFSFAASIAARFAGKDLTPQERSAVNRLRENPATFFLSPSGFRQSVVPLGGFEEAAKRLPVVGDDVGNVMMWLNQAAYGTALTRHEIVSLGYDLYNQLVAGEMGPVTVDPETGALTISAEANANYLAAREALVAWGEEYKSLGDTLTTSPGDILPDNPHLRAAWEKANQEEGAGGLRSVMGLPFSFLPEQWQETHDLNQTYWQLVTGDKLIPAGDPYNKKKGAEVEKFNSQIQAALDKHQEYIQLWKFDPVKVVESQEKTEEALEQIYQQAHKAGIWVPQLHGTGSNTAYEWKKQFAPQLDFYWRANDALDQIQAEQAWTLKREIEGRTWEHIRQEVSTNRDRRLASTPYYDELDAIRKEHDQQAAAIIKKHDGDTQMYLLDQLDEETRGKISAVYDRADKEGVELRGSGRLPQHTSAWYRLDGDRQGRILETEMRDVLSYQAKQDTIQAQTAWVMDQVIEQLDLYLYDDNGDANPRFMRRRKDGTQYVDRELWTAAVMEELVNMPALYQEIVGNFQGETLTNAPMQVYAKLTVTTKELREHIFGDVMPKLDAWRQEREETHERIASMEPGPEKEAAIAEGRRRFGPEFYTFGDLTYRVDHDALVSAVQTRYNELPRTQRDAWREEYPDLFMSMGSGENAAWQVDGTALTPEIARELVDRYGVEVPLEEEQFAETGGKQAISDTWYNVLSSDQRRQWFKLYGEKYPGFITEATALDPDSGEVYTYLAMDTKALPPEGVNEVRDQFGIKLPPNPRLFIEEDRAGAVEQLGSQGLSAEYQALMEQGYEDKRTQRMTRDFFDNPPWLDEQGKAEWGDFQDFVAGHQFEEEVLRTIKDALGASWRDLPALLPDEDVTLSDGSKVNLRAYAQARAELYEEKNIAVHEAARSQYLTSDAGIELLERNPDLFSKYLRDRTPDEVAMIDAFFNGELFLEGEDLENWQAYHRFLDENAELEDAAQALKEQLGVTWKQLPGYVDEGGPLWSYIIDRNDRFDAHGMSGLYEKRSGFMQTDEGQELLIADPEVMARYAGDGGSSGGSGRSSGGSTRSSGGSTRSSGGSSRVTSTSNLGPFARSIYGMDPALSGGTAGDSAQRREIADAVALVLESYEQLFSFLGETGGILRRLFEMMLKRVLGDAPTLENWLTLGQMFEVVGPDGGLAAEEPAPEEAVV